MELVRSVTMKVYVVTSLYPQMPSTSRKALTNHIMMMIEIIITELGFLYSLQAMHRIKSSAVTKTTAMNKVIIKAGFKYTSPSFPGESSSMCRLLLFERSISVTISNGSISATYMGDYIAYYT